MLVPFLGSTPAFAHTGAGSTPMDRMMRQMMGAQTVETMEQMEDQIMGAENHERMENLMNKMLAGTLSEGERQDMVRMMRDAQTSPGAMTMMMRMTMPALALRSGTEGTWLHQALEWDVLVTLVLLAATLVLLLILALMKWLKKNP